MSILDDVVINAKSAAEAVGRKAGQLVDVSKLRISAAEINAEIAKRYEVLGQYVYECSRSTLSADPEAAGQMTEIDELKAQQAAIAKELGDKQNKVFCPVCGKQSPTSAIFCSACGAKLMPDPEPVPQEAGPDDAREAAEADGPDAQNSDIPPRQFP